MKSREFPVSTWRLLHTPPATGAWNMAVDEAIFEAALEGAALPTLRFYSWEPACLSLGYAQPFADIDLPALTGRGWHYVRRPTGGRAILHTDELTYSVSGAQSEPRLTGSILESYQMLAQALVCGLLSLDIPAESLAKSGGSGSQADQGPVCFEVPSHYEITVHGKKLVGSAQSRRKGGVLQHGSLPLYGDLARITQVLVFPDPTARQEATSRLLEHATTAESLLGHPLDWRIAADALQAAFTEQLNIEFVQSELSPAELERAIQLVEAKYAHPSWNQRS